MEGVSKVGSFNSAHPIFQNKIDCPLELPSTYNDFSFKLNLPMWWGYYVSRHKTVKDLTETQTQSKQVARLTSPT